METRRTRNLSWIAATLGMVSVSIGCGDNGNSDTFSATKDASVTPNVDATIAEEDAAVPEKDAAVPEKDAAMPDMDAGVPDLALHYEFEETGEIVSDSSGRDLHGQLSDINAWSAEGRTGRGISLLESTQFVNIPSGVLTNVEDFTISVWVKYNSLAQWARIYDFGNGLGGLDNRFMYFTANGIGGIHAASFGGSPEQEAVLLSQTQLPVGVWKHLALVGTGGERTLYIDGYPAVHVTDAPVVLPSAMEPLGGQSWLGKSRFPDPGMDGSMDDFRIYGRTLSTSEIADLAWPKTDYSYWRFDENSGTTSVESSDHAIATTLESGAGWEVNGRLGSALDLPGGVTGAYASLGTNPLANCTTEMTVSTWVKVRENLSWSRIFDFGNVDSFIYLAPFDGDGNVRFAMIAPTGGIDVVSPTQLFNDDAWHHIAVTVADGSIAIYMDGVVVQTATSETVSPVDFSTATDLWIGKSRFPDPTLNGSIDELRISCRAFTADEITNLSRP